MYLRAGVSSCTATPYLLGTGTQCCQTDLCNIGSFSSAAHTNYEKPSLLIASFAAIVILTRLAWKN